MESAEKYLEESATMFDEFLKENDKNAVEAIKMYVHFSWETLPLQMSMWLCLQGRGSY